MKPMKLRLEYRKNIEKKSRNVQEESQKKSGKRVKGPKEKAGSKKEPEHDLYE